MKLNKSITPSKMLCLEIGLPLQFPKQMDLG